MNTTEKFDYDIEFFDREREKQEILDILKVKPQLINFIYGPINSGKTTLITNLIKNLPDNYVVFYINLRQNPISTYKDFLEELFDAEFEEALIERKITKAIPDAIADLKTAFGIPIPSKLFERIFSSEDPKSAFRYLLKIMGKVKEYNKIPVLIIDELQVIGDLKVDGKLIYKLFNFFIALTKELHICHVFALSSDSLFIESVYSEAMLDERCRYLLIDDFDEQTAKKFLEKHNINRESQELAWNHFGGKPLLLRKFIFAANKKEFIADEILFRKTQLKTMLNKVRELNVKVTIDKEELKIEYEAIIKVLKKFKGSEVINTDECDEISKTFFVNKNILFVDPKKGLIRPQSRIDLLAIREILKEIKQ